LVFGERRLRAFQHLGRRRIPARIVNVSSILAGEYAENELRLDFSVSERVAIAQAVQEQIGRRQGWRTDLAGTRELVDGRPQVAPGQKTRAVAATLAKFGSDHVYRDAKLVVDRAHAGEAIPQLVEAMDTGRLAITVAAQLAKLPKRAQKAALVDGDRSARAVLREARRDERLGDLLKQTAAPLDGSLGRFGVIYADPPWAHEFAADNGRNVGLNHYPTLSLEQVCALPVEDICAVDCLLFLWSPPPLLQEALQVIRAWGFSYRTNAIWDKEVFGMGYYFRGQHEHLLLATRGEPPTPRPADRPSSVIRARRGEHSRKPATAYRLIERMYPSLRKVELFARNSRPGWKSWGLGLPDAKEPQRAPKGSTQNANAAFP